jgi:hypothetical protein
LDQLANRAAHPAFVLHVMAKYAHVLALQYRGLMREIVCERCPPVQRSYVQVVLAGDSGPCRASISSRYIQGDSPDM